MRDGIKQYRVFLQTRGPKKVYKFSRKNVSAKRSPDGKIINLSREMQGGATYATSVNTFLNTN